MFVLKLSGIQIYLETVLCCLDSNNTFNNFISLKFNLRNSLYSKQII